MQYKKIERIDIKNSLTNFNDNQEIVFDVNNQLNFIYGTNGTGKSTLSNLLYLSTQKFQNYDISSKLLDLQNVSNDGKLNVSIWYTDETSTIINDKEINNPIKIPVFNRKYIDSKITDQVDFKNNKFNEQSLIYGIELESKTKYFTKLQEVSKLKEDGINLKENIINNIQKEIKKISNDIGAKTNNKVFNEYNLENLEKISNDEIPSNINDLYTTHISLIQNLKNINEEDKVYFKIDFLENNILNDKINIIDDIIKFNDDKTKLEFVTNYLDNYESNERDWKIQGLSYIKDNKCPFCDSNIQNNSIIDIYKSYISSRIKKYRDLISNNLRELNAMKEQLNNKELLIQKLKKLDNLFNTNIATELDKLYENVLKFLQLVIDALQEKNKDINFYKDCTDNLIFAKEQDIIDIKKNYKKIKIDIENSNIKVNNSTKQRSKENERFLSSIGKYIIYNEIDKDLINLKELRNYFKEKEKELNDLEKAYKEELKTKNILLNTLNSILEEFNITKYRVNENFDLCLNDVVVSFKANEYLSDGEKNIIALSLFISELELLYTEQEKSIIFIDDPITSVDYPNLYNIYVYMEELISKNTNSQFIITSHNTTFLNLFKFRYKKKANYIKLTTNNVGKTITEIDDSKLDTSYIEKLKEIYKVSKEKKIYSNQKLYIHNYCRYIIETLSRFEYPDYDSDTSSSTHYITMLINKITENKLDYDISPIKLKALNKIINKGSHATIENVLDDEMYVDLDYIYCCDAIIRYLKKSYIGQYNLVSFEYDKNNVIANSENKNTKIDL